MALLSVLKVLSSDMSLVLKAVHVHHGIRENSADLDAQFVREQCAIWDIPCQIVEIDVPQIAQNKKVSLEEAGRIVRYAVFDAIAKKQQFDKIAIAHHLNDQVETLLHNLMRGTGLKGLTGMPIQRGKIIRPLIECSRDQVESYCMEQGISFVTDESNLSTVYTRNKIRQQLIPYIVENFNPNFPKQMIQMMSVLRDEDAFLETEATKYYGQCLITEGPELVMLDREQLVTMPMSMRRRIVKKALTYLFVKETDFEGKHIEAVVELMNNQSGREIHLPKETCVSVSYHQLIFQRGIGKAVEKWAFEVNNYETIYPLKSQNIQFGFRIFPNDNLSNFPKNLYTKWFDYDKIKCNLNVRSREIGDFIEIKGPGDQIIHKKIKAFFMDEKVPKSLRDQLPLVADGQHILWVVGYRMSEQYKVSEQTRNILEIKVSRSDEHS